jgi:hypothetical protein
MTGTVLDVGTGTVPAEFAFRGTSRLAFGFEPIVEFALDSSEIKAPGSVALARCLGWCRRTADPRERDNTDGHESHEYEYDDDAGEIRFADRQVSRRGDIVEIGRIGLAFFEAVAPTA